MKKSVAGFCLKFMQTLILVLLASQALLYPFRIKDTIIIALKNFSKQAGFFNIWDLQIEPFLFFGVSPLILKSVAAQLIGILLALVFIFYKTTVNERFKRFSCSQFFLFLLLIFASLSMLWTPTFDFSMKTLFRVFSFALIFLVIKGIPKNPEFVKKSFHLLIGVSIFLEIISLLQNFSLTDNFMFIFPPNTQGRNSMGSMIGHNTGLAAFLFPIFLVSISMILTEKSKWLRLYLGFYQILTVITIMFLQSRSVWIEMIVITPLLVAVLLRNAGRPVFTLRTIGALSGILIFLTLTQVIENPLKMKNPPVSKRIRDFNPAIIIKGSRARILACSMNLIKEKPFFGHGINSFQYVYPKAQGRYFLDNPDTILEPTQKRTDQAHNDYLQILIELGLIGFALAMATIFFYIREGFAGYKKIMCYEGKAIQFAVFCGTAALLVQGLLDFPLHITPLIILLIFLGALWADSANIWIRREEEYQETIRPLISRPGFRYIFPVVFVPLCSAALMWGALIYREMTGDIYDLRGEGCITTYFLVSGYTPEQLEPMLLEAQTYLAKGSEIEPLNGKILFFLGEASYLYSDLLYQEYSSLLDNGMKDTAGRYKIRGLSELRRAKLALEASLTEYKNHSSYQLIGMIYELFYKFEPDNYHYYEKAKEAYQITYEYNPHYVAALISLSDIYSAEINDYESGKRKPPADYSLDKYTEMIEFYKERIEKYK